MIQSKFRNIVILLTSILFIDIASIAQVKSDGDFYDMDLEEAINLSLNKASVIGLPHPHTKGEFHIQYTRMFMPMSGHYEGTTKVTVDEVLSNYGFGMGPMNMRMAPVKMTMNVQMLMFMYSPSDHLTFMAMTNYQQKKMEVQSLNMIGESMSFDTESNAMGDTRLMANYSVRNKDVYSILLDVGVSVPTGSIAQLDKTPMSDGLDIQLAYPMQTGSGTFDPIIEAVYLGSTVKASWGIVGRSLLRLYNNSHDYQFGNHYTVMAGGGYNFKDWLATTARLDFSNVGNVSGSDPNMMAMMMPTARTDLRAGTRIDGSIGLVLEVPKGSFQDLALIIDYRYPLYQNLSGPQMGLDYHFLIGLQYIHGKKTL